MKLITSSGNIINLLGDIRLSIADIARGLSRIMRYTGHSTAYSVAQHSVLVADLCPQSLKMQGLFHDAHEVVTGDVSSPVKQVLEHLHPGVWSDFESRIAGQVRSYYQLPKVLHPSVKDADRKAVDFEIAALFDADGRKAWRSLGYTPDFSRKIEPWTEEEAYRQFRVAYKRWGMGVGE